MILGIVTPQEAEIGFCGSILGVEEMTSVIQRVLVAGGLICLLSTTIACRHNAVTKPVPTAAPTPGQSASMEPDQVNTAVWDKAWTNLLNVAEQSFTPSLPKLLGVEVELVVGNPEEAEDELTLTIADANNKELAVVTKQVQAANSERVVFLMPTDGVELSPGQTYRLRLTGGATFGWKYVVGGYENGEATFNGKSLLPEARSSFLFRTFGEK
jgi:hypothetical protein